MMRKYLFENWFSDENIMYWCRSGGRKSITFASTTMFVEVQWYTRKLSFLKFHKRPKQDILLFFFDLRVMHKYIVEYSLAVEGDRLLRGI